MKQTTDQKIECASCHTEFSCGAKAENCWCFEINLSDEKLAKLRDDFENCLCRNCLSKESSVDYISHRKVETSETKNS